MIRSPDLRIEAKRSNLPGVPSEDRTQDRPTPRLQWRDRVGFAPTSLAHLEAPN